MTDSRIRRRPRAFLPIIALAALAAAACGDDPTGPEAIEDTIFADALGIDLADFSVTASGLYLREDVVGEGELATTGSRPVVEIEGWLPNGSTLQSRATLRYSDPAYNNATLGSGAFIPGFEEAIVGMRVGGTRTAILPAELAYGDNVVIFEITLLEVE